MDILYRDPRVSNLPLGGSPTPTILICIAYFIVVLFLGPAWMKNRKPFNLKNLLIVYNFSLVIASAWMFYKHGKHGWFGRYNWICAEIDYLETEDSLGMVQISYLFFLSKFIEMADTVFFILRKKHSQITFLHVVHHGIVPLLVWSGGMGVSGFNTMFGFFNSFVHTIMYLYYGLAALGPSIQKYLWWKRYLTSLQIFQFVLLALAGISAIVTPGCKIPMIMIANILVPTFFFLSLFANFYRNEYYKRKGKSSENGAGHRTENLNGTSGKLNKLLHKD